MTQRTTVTLFGRDYAIEERRLDGDNIRLRIGGEGPLSGAIISSTVGGDRWRLTLQSGSPGAGRVATNRSHCPHGSEAGHERALVASGERSRMTEGRWEGVVQASDGMLLAWSADRD
jgi:hypothetical protein